MNAKETGEGGALPGTTPRNSKDRRPSDYTDCIQIEEGEQDIIAHDIDSSTPDDKESQASNDGCDDIDLCPTDCPGCIHCNYGMDRREPRSPIPSIVQDRKRVLFQEFKLEGQELTLFCSDTDRPGDGTQLIVNEYPSITGDAAEKYATATISIRELCAWKGWRLPSELPDHDTLLKLYRENLRKEPPLTCFIGWDEKGNEIPDEEALNPSQQEVNTWWSDHHGIDATGEAAHRVDVVNMGGRQWFCNGKVYDVVDTAVFIFGLSSRKEALRKLLMDFDGIGGIPICRRGPDVSDDEALEHFGEIEQVLPWVECLDVHSLDNEYVFNFDRTELPKESTPPDLEESGCSSRAREPAPILDAGDWLEPDAVEEKPVPILHGLADAGSKLAILGASKVKKTWFLLKMALQLATGRGPFFQWKIDRPHVVLLLQAEVTRAHYQFRLRKVTQGMEILPEELKGQLFIQNVRTRVPDFSPLFDRESKRTLENPSVQRLIQDIILHKADVVAIDPVYKFLPGDENRSEDVKHFLGIIDRISEETGALVVYVHHCAKGQAGDRQKVDRFSGSGVFARDYDAAINLTAHRDNDNAIVLESMSRNYPESPPQTVLWKDYDFIPCDLAPIVRTSGDKKKKAVEITDDDCIAASDCSITEFRNRLRNLGLSVRDEKAKVEMLLADGVLVKKAQPGTRVKWMATPEVMKKRIREWSNPKLGIQGHG